MNRIFNLFLKNIRAGFATNSSSTHSLVFYADGYASKILNRHEEYEFGWNNFSLSNKVDKLVYGLITQTHISWIENEEEAAKDRAFAKLEELKPHLDDAISDEEIEQAVKAIDESKYPYVDHQSHPGTFSTAEEQAEYIKTLVQDNVVIYGGNDNGGKDAEDFMLNEGVLEARRASEPFEKVQIRISIDVSETQAPYRPISKSLDDILRVKFAADMDNILKLHVFRVENGRYSHNTILYEDWKNMPETDETISTVLELKEEISNGIY